jgi:hypothetical protein
MSGRHLNGTPVAELLDLADALDWDTSLLSVHARLHRRYVTVPTSAPPRRWRWAGNLFDGARSEAERHP